ncbi:ankyrin [Coniochaeta ligniaria NRRL 30616]|uniref:Ankyrin n=1 Tax=Coniochaeta ligniaria NRRL 30616 TaxID=1408157 RepID=A0A1J7JY07_9PEZI|nr:ankyrin [Coniochaeta ligniaria NRRL 30616]
MAMANSSSDNQSHLLRLTTELVLLIANHLGVEDLHALCLAHSVLYAQINPELYSRDVKNRDSYSLFWAALNGKLSTVKIALEHGADVNRCRLKIQSDELESGYSPLHLAAKHGHEEIVAWLLDRGAQIDAPFVTVNINTHLLRALPPVLQSGSGFRMDTGDPYPWKSRRALHVALAEYQPSVAKLLIDRGASLNFAGTGLADCTALYVAARTDLHSIIDLLANRLDFNVNQRNTFGSTALHYACGARDERDNPAAAETVAKLLSLNANIEARDSDGATPLMVACCGGSKYAAYTLINAGANVYAEHQLARRTPLFFAMWYEKVNAAYWHSNPGLKDLVITLLSRGARLDQPAGSLTRLQHTRDPLNVFRSSPWAISLSKAYSDSYGRLRFFMEHATPGKNLMWESVKPALHQPLRDIPIPVLGLLLGFAKRSLSDAEFAHEVSSLMDVLIQRPSDKPRSWYRQVYYIMRQFGASTSASFCLVHG